MERISLDNMAQNHNVRYKNHKIALLNNLRDIDYDPDDEFFLESYIIAFVEKGNAEVIMGDQKYSLGEGDVFSCRPKNIVKRSMFSMDFESRVFIISPEYVDELSAKIPGEILLRTIVYSRDIRHVEPDVMKEVILYYDLLKMKISGPDSPSSQLSIDSLTVSLAYLITPIFSIDNLDLPERSNGSAHNIFNKFVLMLNDPKVPFMSVNDYAGELNISAKYFSAICKQMSGKSASDIINEEKIRVAKQLLSNKSKNIKQIADELNFANQSHFGTFFKRYVGISPQKFRDEE